jgi:hypothetical protein
MASCRTILPKTDELVSLSRSVEEYGGSELSHPFGVAAIPGSELIALPDAPHMMQIECVGDLAKAAKGFLEGRGKRRQS